MRAFLIQAIYLTSLLSISIRAADGELTTTCGPAHPEESGVMTHGTIFAIGNDQIVVLSSKSREPLRYFHGEGTVYVDEGGNPIALKVVRSGAAVTVFYTQAEGQRMANRVVVGKSQTLRGS